jgi:hypothetical protein
MGHAPSGDAMRKASGGGFCKPMSGERLSNASSSRLFSRHGSREAATLLRDQRIVRLEGGGQIQLGANELPTSEREPEHRALIVEQVEGLLAQFFSRPLC